MLNPVKTMQSIINKVEQARKGKAEVITIDPEPIVERPEVEYVDAPKKAPALQPQQARGGSFSGAGKGRPTGTPTYDTPPPPLGTREPRGRPDFRKGGRKWDSGGDYGQRRQDRSMSYERPNRCSNIVASGEYCGTYNHQEARFCNRCGIPYPNGLPRDIPNERGPRGQGGFMPRKWGYM